MLRDRLVAAALGLPMLFLLLVLNWFLRRQGSTDDFALLLIVLLIAGMSGWEVSQVIRHRFPHASPWNGVYAALLLPFLVHMVRLAVTPYGLMPVSSLGLLIDSLGATAAVMLLFLGVWGDVEQRGRQGLVENVIAIGWGCYLGATLSTLLLLGQTRLHEVVVAFVFVCVFALDTAAYFGGKHFGGPPLAPHVSPKKTLSGSLCGLAASVLIALAFKAAILLALQAIPAGQPTEWGRFAASLQWWQLAVMGASIGILGQAGDLLESAFKRWGGVKDSGVIIPGHGGFLDRFDSLYLSAPAGYLLTVLFLRMLS